MVNITWEDSQFHAEWVNKRLPTEAEWEWAARGTEGREYPWGKQASQDCSNFKNPETGASSVDKYAKGQHQSHGYPCPVASVCHAEYVSGLPSVSAAR